MKYLILAILLVSVASQSLRSTNSSNDQNNSTRIYPQNLYIPTIQDRIGDIYNELPSNIFPRFSQEVILNSASKLVRAVTLLQDPDFFSWLQNLPVNDLEMSNNKTFVSIEIKNPNENLYPHRFIYKCFNSKEGNFDGRTYRFVTIENCDAQFVNIPPNLADYYFTLRYKPQDFVGLNDSQIINDDSSEVTEDTYFSMSSFRMNDGIIYAILTIVH